MEHAWRTQETLHINSNVLVKANIRMKWTWIWKMQHYWNLCCERRREVKVNCWEILYCTTLQLCVLYFEIKQVGSSPVCKFFLIKHQNEKDSSEYQHSFAMFSIHSMLLYAHEKQILKLLYDMGHKNILWQTLCGLDWHYHSVHERNRATNINVVVAQLGTQSIR